MRRLPPPLPMLAGEKRVGIFGEYGEYGERGSRGGEVAAVPLPLVPLVLAGTVVV